MKYLIFMLALITGAAFADVTITWTQDAVDANGNPRDLSEIAKFRIDRLADADGNYRVFVDNIPPDARSWNLPHDAYEYKVVMRTFDINGDNSGVSNAVQIPVEPVDTIPPQVAFISPADGAVFNTTPISVTGTASDDVALASVTVNGADVGTTGTWSIDIGLTEGSNVITVVATDTSGNTATDSIQVTYEILDTTPPELSVTSPADGATVSSTPVNVTGTASDNVGLASVTVNGIPVVVTAGAYSVDVDLIEGVNAITVIATDTSGNTNQVDISVTYEPVVNAPFVPPVIESVIVTARSATPDTSTVVWTQQELRTDGSPGTEAEISAYRVYTSATQVGGYVEVAQVAPPTNQYTFTDLASTSFVCIDSLDNDGLGSECSGDAIVPSLSLIEHVTIYGVTQ